MSDCHILHIVLRNIATRICVEFEKHSVLLLIIAAVVAAPFYLTSNIKSNNVN